LITNGAGVYDKRWLYNTNGDAPIYPEKDVNFKYLGLIMNLNLDWNDEIKKTNKIIFNFCSNLIKSKISTVKGIELIKTILLSKIDITLTHATIPEKILKKWNRKIIITLFRLDGWSQTLSKNISEHCMVEISQCNLLFERYYNNHLKEFYYNMNSNNIDYISGINRLSCITKMDQSNHFNVYNKSFSKIKKYCHYLHIIDYYKKYDIKLNGAPELDIKIINIIYELTLKLIHIDDVCCLFTDGSTIKGNNVSGIGICVPGLNININFAMETYGNNFMAEVVL